MFNNGAANTETNNPKVRGSGIGKALKVFSFGMNVYMPYAAFQEAKEAGRSNFGASMAAGTEFMGWQVAAPVMMGKMFIEAGTALWEAGNIAGRNNRASARRGYKQNFGGHYVDTENAANMRQAGMMSIQQSKSMVNSSLGGEAKTYYRNIERY